MGLYFAYATFVFFIMLIAYVFYPHFKLGPLIGIYRVCFILFYLFLFTL